MVIDNSFELHSLLPTCETTEIFIQ